MNRILLGFLSLMLLLIGGCATGNSFRLPSGTLMKEAVTTFDARNNRARDIDVVVYVPKALNARRPALIFLSGCNGGHFEIHEAVAREFNTAGAVIAEVKSIEAYGDQCLTSTLPGSVRAEHVFLTRDFLVDRGLASPDNVSVVGLSHGGWTAISASKLDVQPTVISRLKYPHPLTAAVALYPWCDLWGPRRPVTNPMLVLAGSADTWTPAIHCSQTMLDDPNIILHIYEGVTHAWDAPRPPRTVPTQFGSTFLTYDRNATLDSISRSISFLRQHLKFE